MEQYQVGGALRAGGIYVVRATDAETEAALLAGDCCHVLGPRQIGKSSLRLRLMRLLEAQGVRVASVDLSGLGVSGSADRWLAAFVDELAAELDLDEITRGWPDGQGAGRLAQLLGVALPARLGAPLALFLDEVDALVSSPEAADALLGALRAARDRSMDGPHPLRLCLLGVVAPFELGGDLARTPFNISRPIALDDFTRAELAPLGAGFPAEHREALLDLVYGWTHGHPYLSHRLCERLAAEPPEGPLGEAVDRRVQALFVAGGVHGDGNLAGAARRLQVGGDDLPEMLALYRRALEAPTEADGRRTATARLLLTGLVAWRATPEGRRLAVRNRIYAAVMDRDWVDEQLERRPFQAALDGWRRAGESPDWLLRGVALADAERWAQERADLSAEEMGFLLRSGEVWRQESLARAELEQRRLGDAVRDAEARRLRVRAWILGIAAAIGLGVAGGVYYAGRRIAEGATLARQANANLLLVQAEVFRGVPDEASAAVSAATRLALADGPEARGAMLVTLDTAAPAAVQTWQLRPNPRVPGLVARAGRVLAPDFGDLLVMDARTGTVLQSLPEGGHQGRALSPDGARLAWIDATFTVRVVDTDRGTERLRFPLPGPPTHALHLTWSPDGAVLVALLDQRAGVAPTIEAFDPASGAHLWRVPFPDPVLSRSWADPSGAWLSWGSSQGQLEILDRATGLSVWSSGSARLGAYSHTWSPAGDLISGWSQAGGDGTLFRLTPAAIRAGAPAAPLVARAGRWGGGEVVPLDRLKTASVQAGGGDRLWVGGDDGTLSLLDTRADALLARFRVGASRVVSAVEDEVGGVWTLCLDGTLRRWRLTEAVAAWVPREGSAERSAAFFVGATEALTSVAPGQVERRSPASGAILDTWPTPGGLPTERLVADPSALWIGDREGLWRQPRAGGAPTRMSTRPDPLRALAASPDGRSAAWISVATPLQIWRDGQIRTVPTCRSSDDAISYAADGRRLAVACLAEGVAPDLTVRVLDLAEDRETELVRVATPVHSLVWQGEVLVAGLRDGRLMRWDAQGRPLPDLSAGAGVYDLASSEDGRWLASATMDRRVRVWDATGALVAVTPPFAATPIRLGMSREELLVRLDGQVARLPLRALTDPAADLLAEQTGRWGLEVQGGRLVER